MESAISVMSNRLEELGIDVALPLARLEAQRSSAEVVSDEDEEIVRRASIGLVLGEVNRSLTDAGAAAQFLQFAEDVPGWEGEEPVWLLLTHDERAHLVATGTLRPAQTVSAQLAQGSLLTERRVRLHSGAARTCATGSRCRTSTPRPRRHCPRHRDAGRRAYGDEVFLAAAIEIHARGLSDVGALAVACEHQRKGRHRPVPIEFVLPAHLDDADVVPHDLGTYDE